MRSLAVLAALAIVTSSATSNAAPLHSSSAGERAIEEPRSRFAQAEGSDRIVYSARKCDPGANVAGSETCTFEIYTVALDGSAPQQLTFTAGTDDVWPMYSPDGTEIAFNSWDKVRYCDSHVWLMEADGSNPRMISSPIDSWVEGSGWSPDGDIAFTRWPSNAPCDANDHADVFLLSRTGEVWAEEPLLTRLGSEYEPAFAPNGRRIAYAYDADRDGTYSPGDWRDYDIWVSRADGSGHERLTKTPRRVEWSPAWSPDGKWIALSTETSSEGQIWIMRGDGSQKRRLTQPGYFDYDPAWSPDGTRIAFSRCLAHAEPPDCAVAIFDVSDPERIEILVHEEGYMAIQPSWQPRAES